jgi:hypothetical protein
MRALKISALLLFCLFVLLAAFLAYHLYSNVPVTNTEVFRDDEEEQAQRAANNFVNVIKETATSYAARGAHAKGHACVKAYFNIAESIEKDLQHGIFRSPGKIFKSWIRFSNGASNLANSQDGKNDSRGMAVKLFNVNEGIANSISEPSQVQDFLMHNNPVFFSGNIEDYNQLVESDNKILSFFSSKNPFKWRIRELGHVLDTLSPPPFSPLWDDYFSNTAYRLGPHNIKFSTQPCSSSPKITKETPIDDDFLSHTMAKELSNGEACFNFQVQLQDVNKYMPIENPSIEWRAADSPFITLATIRIPQQSFDSEERQQFCENLSFSPWNSSAAHQPIGELNRIRKMVYAASSRYRHAQNKTQVPTQLDW